MTTLYPTKTRLALLRAVAAGNVIDLPDDKHDAISTFDTTGAEEGEPARRVSARVDELARAGWVCYGRDGVTLGLTDAGREVLAKADVLDRWRSR